jgi:hypothetical protein
MFQCSQAERSFQKVRSTIKNHIQIAGLSTSTERSLRNIAKKRELRILLSFAVKDGSIPQSQPIEESSSMRSSDPAADFRIFLVKALRMAFLASRSPLILNFDPLQIIGDYFLQSDSNVRGGSLPFDSSEQMRLNRNYEKLGSRCGEYFC